MQNNDSNITIHRNNDIADPANDKKVNEILELIKAENDEVTFTAVQSNGIVKNAIHGLWRDKSVGIVIPDSEAEARNVLNNITKLFFPSTLSAIYHKSTRSLEFIWSAFLPSPAGAEVIGRQFEFRFEGRSYQCRFAPSSNELHILAENFIELGATETDYRNLRSFRSYLRGQNDAKLDRKGIFGSPRCFWIDNIEYDEDLIEATLDSLNFYLHYYDNKSPSILIHNEAKKSYETNSVRYIHGNFPTKISARPLDRNLTNFWSAAQSNDSSQRFLYSYRIIEYAGTNYIETAPKQAIRKVLLSPHISDNIDQACADIITAMSKSKIDDYNKFEAIMKLSVSPDVLWRYIEKNLDAFAKKLEFDGGHTVPPLVSGPESYKDFCNNGLSIFASTIRKIRNALSHGKDEKQQQVILPTHKNAHNLAAWAELTRLAAGEVILFESC
ncbi:hypothetical protein ABDF71_22715 [Ochrobactrum sp. WV_118_8]|uniref:hypothetical protein n=1 Tax=Brucella anthropi TaxID=529 RepID=UPI002158682E|nr:hypothetical protein [Brucella anthropi]MCR8492786.1 hypothetical protein [Brucella anthropi]